MSDQDKPTEQDKIKPGTADELIDSGRAKHRVTLDGAALTDNPNPSEEEADNQPWRPSDAASEEAGH